MYTISGQATAISINAGISRIGHTFQYRLLKADMTQLTAFTGVGVNEAKASDNVTGTGSFGAVITTTNTDASFLQWYDVTDGRYWLFEVTVISQYPADIKKINANALSASKLQLSADTMVTGTVDTATFTPTTTQFEADDITEATADHYNGRVIIFTSGNLKNQAMIIKDYVLANGKGKFTSDTAMTEAPANNDEFIIV